MAIKHRIKFKETFVKLHNNKTPTYIVAHIFFLANAIIKKRKKWQRKKEKNKKNLMEL